MEIEIREIKEIQVTWRRPDKVYVKCAVLRDGQLEELTSITREEIKQDIDGCIEFLKTIKENLNN